MLTETSLLLPQISFLMKTNRCLTSVYKHRICLSLCIPPAFGKCFCVYDDKQLGSVKGKEFLDKKSITFLKYAYKAGSEIEAVGLHAGGSHFVPRRDHHSPSLRFFFIFLSPRRVPECYSLINYITKILYWRVTPVYSMPASCFGPSCVVIMEYQLIKKRTFEDAMFIIP